MEKESLDKKRPGIAKWLVGGTLGLAAFISFYLMITSTPAETMIMHAERLALWERTPLGSFPLTRDGVILDHHWLPGGELLRTPFTLKQNGAFAIQLEKLDGKTGASISEKPLSLHSIQKSTVEEPRLSPDGKWLFLEDSGDYALINTETATLKRLPRAMRGVGSTVVLASTLDSNISIMEMNNINLKQPRTRRNVNFPMLAYRIAWMPDSKHFLEIFDDNKTRQSKLVIRNLDDSLVDEIKIEGYPTGVPPKLLGVTPKNEAMIVSQSSYCVDNGYVLIDLKTMKSTAEKFKNIPQGLLVKQIEMSPDGKRLLWKTVNVNPDPARTIKLMLDQMVFRRDLQFRVNLKVSDLDGGNMHEICGEMLSGKQEDGFQMAHWIPGGKKISFWYKDAVYAVSAE